MRSLHAFSLAVLLLATSSCDSQAPAGPSRQIAVTSSSDVIYIGSSDTFAANVTAPASGAGPASDVTWSSNAPDIATVDPTTGVVTGVGAGTVMITAQAGDGARALRQIRVVPNFHGAWTGDYTEMSCSDEQGRRVDCWHPSRVSGVGFFIYQTGATLTVDLIHSGYSNFVDGTAIVETDGQLTVQDRGGSEEYGIVTTLWRLRRGSNGALSGTMTHTYRYSDGTEFRTENTVYDVIKWSDLNG